MTANNFVTTQRQAAKDPQQTPHRPKRQKATQGGGLSL